MLGHDEGPALQTDAYIDTLLSQHVGLPVSVPTPGLLPTGAVQRAIELLERALPRVHPSFRFEEHLAARLRAVAEGHAATDIDQLPLGELVVLPVPGAAAFAAGGVAAGALDRRLLVGGAIASGFSLAGAAAMLAWRRSRSRRRWLD